MYTPPGAPPHDDTDDHSDEDEPLSSVEQLRSRLLTTDEVRNLPPPKPLIDGYLNLDSVALLYGASGAGKSFAALDIAMSVTSRRRWFGRDVTNGGALYVVAEGAGGIGQRTEAWMTHHGTEGTVTWLPEAVNIYSPQWASALAELVADLQPVLVVVDTFARCIVGADENSARDVGQAVAHLDQIRRAAGCCVLIVHQLELTGSVDCHGSGQPRRHPPPHARG